MIALRESANDLNWGFICAILFAAGFWGLIGAIIWWVA